MKFVRLRSAYISALLLELILLGLASSLRAYVPIRSGSAGVHVIYGSERFPLLFQVHDKTATGIPNMAAGSNPLAAFKAALAAWQSIQTASIRFSDLQITSMESTNSMDGANLITMADTPTNAAIFGSPNTLALTRLVFNPITGRITETDIIFNPRVNYSTNLASGTFDLQSVATHELGHALGNDHAAAQNDTMFYLGYEREFFARYLSADSIAFASATYPNAQRVDLVGSMTGRVTMGGSGVFGASVTAMDVERNLIYTAITDPDGRYTMTGPIPGKYAIYVEPLDGPAPADQLLGSGGEGFYKGLNTTFQTVVMEDQNFLNADRVNLALRATEVNFALSSTPATLNINRMGRDVPATGSVVLRTGAAVVNPGETVEILIGGPDVSKVASLDDIKILGTGITIDRSRPIRTVDFGSGILAAAVAVRVAADAAPGPRTVTVKVGDQRVASTGGIVVSARALPTRTLYIPYFFATSAQYTGVAMANPTTTPAVVRVIGRDNQGDLTYDGDAIVPADLTIAGGAQTAKLERQIFNLPSSTQQTGSITVESESQELQSFFLAGDFNSTYLDGAEAFTRAYKELYFVDVIQNSNTSTEVHLMNVREIALPVQLSLVGSNGAVLRSMTRTIPGKGKIGELVASLFTFTTDLNSAHVKAVASEDALVGFGFIRQANAVFGINAQPAEDASSNLYSAQLATGNFGVNFSTRLNIVNVGGSTTTVTLTVLGDSGQILAGPSSPASVPAGGHLTVDVQSLFGFGGPTQGSVRIVGGSGAKLLGNVLFGDGNPTTTRLGFGAALPLSAAGTTRFLFSQVAQAQGFYTGVAFLAPDGADLNVQAFREDGTQSGSKSLTLAAGARSVSLLQVLIPTTKDQLRGYVKVTSTKPVIGFSLFGATGGQFLSAVPPQPISSN